jgi:hypothetical protein
MVDHKHENIENFRREMEVMKENQTEMLEIRKTLTEMNIIFTNSSEN